MNAMHHTLEKPNRRTMIAMAMSAAATLPATARSLAAIPAPAPGMKFMSLLVRKDGIDAETFRDEWLRVHAPLALGIPHLRGFVLSEIVPPHPEQGLGSIPALPQIAGISTSWWDSSETRDAARQTPEMKAWVAHGNKILDREKSLSITLGENVVSRPQTEGTVKRVGLMRRKAGTSHDDCMRYWMDIHVPMAADVPGLRGFIVSECVGPSAPADIDGIVETWWDSVADREQHLATPGGRAWNADGRLFLDIPGSRGIFAVDRTIIPAPTWA